MLRYLRKAVPARCKLDSFAIIKHSLTNESSMKKIEDHNTLVSIVDNAVDEAKKEMKRLLNSRSKFVDRKEKPKEWERLKLEKRDVKQNSSRPQKAPITARLVCACRQLRVSMFFTFNFQDPCSILERYPRTVVCYPK
uniref:Ovule protein n=1 Tax=Angiostrongylus cantonensis TaxID=6313 RepID=A0A0K0DDN4_ANGCA